MQNYDQNEVERICLYTIEQQEDLLMLEASLAIPERIEIEKIKTVIWQKNCDQINDGKQPEFNFAVHLLALGRLYEKNLSGKEVNATKERWRVDSVVFRKIKDRTSNRRSLTAETRIRELYYDIKKLRDINLSWQDIAGWLPSYYREGKAFKKGIDHNYLAKLYQDEHERRIQRAEKVSFLEIGV